MERQRPNSVTVAAGLAFALVAALSGCGRGSEQAPPPRLVPITGQQASPDARIPKKEEQPPFVKVRRDKEGVYTWEITGRDVARVVEADAALRRRFGTRPAAQRPGADGAKRD